MQLLEALAATPVFCAADPARLAATAALWHERTLRPAQVLWYEDEPANEVAVVMEGSLEVLVSGRTISSVGAAAGAVSGRPRGAAPLARRRL